MNYRQTLDYLYSRLPMFTRVGSAAYKADLSNTIELCRILHNPHQKFKSIHVGGTNGKGSTSHMLAAILQIAGYKTGLYTSPHLKDFRERIRINGEMISEEEVIQFVSDHKMDIETIEPSFFEATVAMAFNHFANQKVDIAVIEVGLGGRLDSTNIISPLLSVITNISYDHMNILGDTLWEIATEKAGIIKSQTPVIIGQKQDEVSDIFVQKSNEAHSQIRFSNEEWVIEKSGSREVGKSGKTEKSESLEFLEVIIKPNTTQQLNNSTTQQHSNVPIFQRSNSLTSRLSDFRTSGLHKLKLDLTGSYQLKNLATVLTAVDELCKQGFNITDEHIKTALKQVKNLTGLMGRWQTLSIKPLVICDTGHNEDGIREVLKNIEATPHKNLHIVMGMVKDKDISKILSLLPQNAQYYFCQPDIPRAKSANELKTEALAFKLEGESYGTIQLALKAAKKQAAKNDLIFVGGSTFVVAEVV